MAPTGGTVCRFGRLHAAALGIAILACSCSAPVPELLFDLTKNRLEERDKRYPEVIGEAIVPLDTKAISPDRNIGIRLGTGSVILFATRSRELRPNGTLVWTASVGGSRYETATFAISNGILTASIDLPDGRTFRVVHFKGNLYRIQQIDRSKIPTEACIRQSRPRIPIHGRPPVPAQAITAPCTPSDPATEIDVMVVYTVAALQEAGSDAQLQNTVEIARTKTNDSYLNSDIAQRLRLQYPILQVAYAEAAVPEDDLDNIISGNAQGLGDVHTNRDLLAADIVVLVTGGVASDCGIALTMPTHDDPAWEAKAYAVVPYRCLFDNNSLAHELGHVMGARHDIFVDATIGAPFDYNHGFVEKDPKGGAQYPWFTIMATGTECSAKGVEGCLRIPFWSNPDAAFGWYERSTGTPGKSDNHQTLNNTAQLVANFRCSASRKEVKQPR